MINLIGSLFVTVSSKTASNHCQSVDVIDLTDGDDYVASPDSAPAPTFKNEVESDIEGPSNLFLAKVQFFACRWVTLQFLECMVSLTAPLF